MSQSSIFRWRDGLGWLVLSGGGDYTKDETTEVDAEVLSRTVSHNPLAYIWAAGSDTHADNFLDYLNDLGGRTHFLVDVMTEDDNTIRQQLRDAGIIILGDGENQKRLLNGVSGVVIEAIAEAYENGATIYAPGRSAGLLAAWSDPTGLDLLRGMGWVEDAIVMPDYSAERSEAMKAHLQAMPEAFGLGLAKGSAIAFNAENGVELWGNQQVTVLLGQSFTPPSSI